MATGVEVGVRREGEVVTVGWMANSKDQFCPSGPSSSVEVTAAGRCCGEGAKRSAPQRRQAAEPNRTEPRQPSQKPNSPKVELEIATNLNADHTWCQFTENLKEYLCIVQASWALEHIPTRLPLYVENYPIEGQKSEWHVAWETGPLVAGRNFILFGRGRVTFQILHSIKSQFLFPRRNPKSKRQLRSLIQLAFQHRYTHQ